MGTPRVIIAGLGAETQGANVAARFGLCIGDWDGKALLVRAIVALEDGQVIAMAEHLVAHGHPVRWDRWDDNVIELTLDERARDGREPLYLELSVWRGRESLDCAWVQVVFPVDEPETTQGTSCPHEAILGIRAPYSAWELKQAFRREVSVWHPDRFAGRSADERREATERTRRIMEAYEALRSRCAA